MYFTVRDVTEKSEMWETRRNISSFTLTDNEITNIINNSSHAVVSWVTKSNEPVTAVMLYVVIDGLITVTSTTNRAKYHAWKRNPSTSFCIWDHGNIGKQVTLRGTIKITKDDELLHRYTKAFLTRAMDGNPPSKDRLAKEMLTFQAPDRHMMQLHVQSKLSHDLNALLVKEKHERSLEEQS